METILVVAELLSEIRTYNLKRLVKVLAETFKSRGLVFTLRREGCTYGKAEVVVNAYVGWDDPIVALARAWTAERGPTKSDIPKFQIGQVGFGKPCSKKQNSAGWVQHSVIGKPRLNLLRRAMLGDELPDGLFLIATRDGASYKKISTNEVDWESSQTLLLGNFV